MRVLRRPIADGMAGEGIADIAVSVGVNESTIAIWLRGWEGRPSTGKYDQSLAQNQWKRWMCEEAVVAYTRTDLPIAERSELLNRSYAAVAGFLRDYRQRPAGPRGIK